MFHCLRHFLKSNTVPERVFYFNAMPFFDGEIFQINFDQL